MSATEFPKETILSDDYPIYGNFLYVVDGHLVLSNYHGITVKKFKALLGATEVRRCDIQGRRDAAK